MTFVVPAPLTVLFKVPPFKFNLPALETFPPTFEALMVNPPACVIEIFWLIAAFELTVPVTFVVPAPETVFDKVPPFKVRVPAFVTLPLILEALELIVPEFVTTPESEPKAALLVKVTPLLTVTA